MPVFLTHEDELEQIRVHALKELQKWANQFQNHCVTISKVVGGTLTAIHEGKVLKSRVSLADLSVTFRFEDKLVLFPSDSKHWKINVQLPNSDKRKPLTKKTAL